MFDEIYVAERALRDKSIQLSTACSYNHADQENWLHHQRAVIFSLHRVRLPKVSHSIETKLSGWQQPVTTGGSGRRGCILSSSWVAIHISFSDRLEIPLPWHFRILPAQAHSQIAAVPLLENLYKQTWGQRLQGKVHSCTSYTSNLFLFLGLFLMSLFAKNGKTMPYLESLSKMFLIISSSLSRHQMNWLHGAFLPGSFYFILIPTARPLGIALVLFCCC